MKFGIAIPLIVITIAIIWTTEASHRRHDERKPRRTEDDRRNTSFENNYSDRNIYEKPFTNNRGRYRPYTTSSSSRQRLPEREEVTQPKKTVIFTCKEQGARGVEYNVQFDEIGKVKCRAQYLRGRYVMSVVGVRIVPGSNQEGMTVFGPPADQKCIPPGLTQTYATLTEQMAINRCEDELVRHWASFYCKGVIEWCGDKKNFYIKSYGNIPGYNFISSSHFESNEPCSRAIRRNYDSEKNEFKQPTKTIIFACRQEGSSGHEYKVQFDEIGKVLCRAQFLNGKFITSLVGERIIAGVTKKEQKCIPAGLTRTYAAYTEQMAINRCEDELLEGQWASFYCKGVLQWCGDKKNFFIKGSGTNIPAYNFMRSSYFESNEKCTRTIKHQSDSQNAYSKRTYY